MTPPGSPGTASDGYRIEKPVGRHRAPPTPPRPDRFTVPIAAAAAILTCASLIAIAGQAVAPDASAAASTTTAPTAARTARTVHVPLTILPAPVPTIGASGAWDPETDTRIPVSAPSEAARPPQAVPTGTRSATAPSQTATAPLVATTDPTPTVAPTPSASATTVTAVTTTTASATEASGETTEPSETITPEATETAEISLPTDLPIDVALP